MTFVNTSMIPAFVSIDLSNHPGYRIEDSHVTIEKSSEETQRPGTSTIETHHHDEFVWKFQVDSGTEYPVDLIFKPNKLVTEEFTIPIYINGVLSHVEKTVTSNSLIPPVSLSEMVINFGNKVVNLID